MPWDGCLNEVTLPDGTKDSVATLNCLPVIFQNLVGTLMGFAGLVAVIFILYAGFKYITAGGDPKQAESARKTLTFAIIGLLVVLLSFFIINIIGYISGVNCITTFGIHSCE